MRTSSLTALFLTGVILAAAGNAVAAGLGKLTVLSSLGDRLSADVELVSVTPAEVSSLKARVAPPQAYAHSNVPYSMALSDLHVKVEKHANGRPYLRITSTQPYNEPYLDVLLQLSWEGGEITREYTALVNPAGYHMPPAAAATAPRSSTQAATAAAPAPQTRSVPQTRSMPRARPAPAVAPAHAPDGYRVKHGDTLYGIAEATMPTEVTVDQMLIGLYRANPHVFHGNINRMTAGKILRIPSTEQIEQVPASKARREVKLQIANWHAYRNRIAAAASRKPAAAPEAGGTVSGKISTKVEEAHPAGAAAQKDVVRLSKSEAPGAAAGKGESATARLQALEEEAGARQKALDEANSRITQLEKTISDMRKLIAIKSAGMASAQQQAQQAASTPAAPTTGATTNAVTAAGSTAPAGSNTSASAPASTVASSAPTVAAAGATAAAASATEPGAAAAPSGSAAAPSGSAAASNSTTESNSTAESNPAATSQPATSAGSTAGPAAATTAAATAAASKPETATAAVAKEAAHGAAGSGAAETGQSAEKPVAGKAEAKPAAKKVEATAAHAAPKHHVIPKPAPQPGFFQMLTENPLYIGVAVIIILLLIYFWIRRRRVATDDGELELQAAPLLAGGAAAATTAAAFATVKDSPPAASPQPVPSPEPQPAAQAGAISDDVDPLAEAEVYIAYGRDEQAEEILKDALVHHPERTDVQVKLLEVYAARKDTAAFEALAQKLHQSVGSGSEEWLKVAALGYTLAPANPLFEAGKAAPSSASPASAPDGLDFELDMPTAQTTTDIQLDPAAEDESVSKTGRLSAQFAAAGLELTAPYGAIAPDFVLPGGTPGPEDTQRIAEGEQTAADEPAPIPDFTLGRDSNASAGLDFGDPDEHATAHTDGESGKTLNLEDSQLLMDEALKAARAEPLMPDFQLDLPAQSGSATTGIGPNGSDHAMAPDLALDAGKSGDQPMDLALEPDAGAPGSGKGSAPTFDLSGINLEFDEEQPSATPASGEKDGHWHDVQTKFDLAKAYQEMGDGDGAKEILREVIEEGDAEQQMQAKALLRNLD